MTYNEFIKILEENTAEHLCVYMHCNTKNGTISISPADILELLNEKRIENQKQKPKTNYDRIKQMSIEEMSEFISHFTDGYHTPAQNKRRRKDMIKWLEQEAEENDR